jgi:uncharacterized protein (TIGR02246 family)
MTPVSSDRVAAIYQALLSAWNQRRADAFAALFTEDGTAVGFDGSQMNGRAEIETTLGGIFQNQPTATYVSQIREVRTLADGVVLLRAVVGMVPPGAFEIIAGVNAIQSVVFVQQREDLKIALLQSTPAAFHGRPELAEALYIELQEIARNERRRH